MLKMPRIAAAARAERSSARRRLHGAVIVETGRGALAEDRGVHMMAVVGQAGRVWPAAQGLVVRMGGDNEDVHDVARAGGDGDPGRQPAARKGGLAEFV
jgi:hypothetical protein